MFNSGARNFKLEIFKVQISGAARRANCTRIGGAIGIDAHCHLPRLIRPAIGRIREAAFEAVLVENNLYFLN